MTQATKPRDIDLIGAIADRAVALASEVGYTYRKTDVVLDILCVHTNLYPLRLEEMLSADDGDFGHDVFGINKYLDHDTFELTDCFFPRFAR